MQENRNSLSSSFLRLLEMGGRAAVVVPDGILFGTSNAHVAIRKKLIEENRLDAVVSMPSDVLKPAKAGDR
jgi:type I restriction enzyme M protein